MLRWLKDKLLKKKQKTARKILRNSLKELAKLRLLVTIRPGDHAQVLAEIDGYIEELHRFMNQMDGLEATRLFERTLHAFADVIGRTQTHIDEYEVRTNVGELDQHLQTLGRLYTLINRRPAPTDK